MSQSEKLDLGKSKCNRKHLTLDNRKLLKDCLLKGLNQLEIANALKVSKTTITREILAHRKQVANRRSQLESQRLCEKRHTCEIKHICENMKCTSKCKNCQYGKNCINLCPAFSKISCNRQNRFPYVCDGCSKASVCILPFYRYNPEEAHKESLLVLSSSRSGINMTEEEFAALDALVVEGTNKGQSIEHIVHANNLDISPRSIRNYIKQGYTTTKPLDTPRGVTYKPRKTQISKKQQNNIREAKIGRDLASFLNYASQNSFVFFTQMDTVEGKKGDINLRRLLTIIVVRIRLFYCVPIENGSPASIVAAFNNIYRILGKEDYQFLFNILITDNGAEFSDVRGIELDPTHHETRSRVFFCNPYASWEKGAIEVCHELLRRIIPKGTSMANITVAQTESINSHINSYFRQSNDGLSAYDTFVRAFGDRAKRILNKLHIERIDANDVIIHPSLLKS